MSSGKAVQRQRRASRVRKVLAHRRRTKPQEARVRLTVFRADRNIYAQVIDDRTQQTLAAASSLDLRDTLKSGANKDAAAAVGKLVAERALAADVKQVAFDRGGHPYHGRVKALADAAREGGLEF